MNSSSRTRPFAEVTFRASETHFLLKITTFRAPAIYSNFTEYCAWHKKWHSKITKCCACHEKWFSWLISVTYETSFTMCGATSITLQPHQMLPLPRKMMRIIDCRTSFTMRGATGITLQPHQILRLPRKSALQNLSEILRERLKRQFQCAADSSMIRAWSDHELVISHPPVRRGYFSRFGDAFCIENYNISRSGYLFKFHRILRLPRKVTLRHHQILRLPRKVRLLLNCDWTELLLSCYWTVTKLLLSCYWTVTELILDCHWTVTELACYWAVTELLLNCYWTELLLNCYWTVTQLLLNWPVTELLLTQLLLNWPVTELLLNCY